MATFLSSRVKNLKVGIPGYTDGTEVAGFVGNIDIDGEISVSTFNDGGSTGLTNYVIAADGSGGWSWQSIGAVGAVTSPGGADGQVQYNNNGSMSGASVFYYDDVNNRVGIGTSSPGYAFEVSGDASFLGNIRDKDGDTGTFGQLLMATGTGVDWVDAAPADAITGLNIYEEGVLQGGANAVASLDFRGSYITATVVGSTSTITMNESPNFTGLTVNSNTVWHAGNDGTGSGLDADLLDGQQGTYYLDYTNLTNRPTIGNAVITIAAGVGMTGGGDFTTNQTIAETITITHADTSTQASVNNSNGVVIQDITLDGFGHITALGSIDLDGRYYTETEADARFLGINAKAANSDLLDGQDSTYYLNTSATTQTKSGGLNISGDLGVGTTSPSTKFHVVGDSTFTSNVSIGGVIDIIPYDTLNNGTLSFEGSAGQLFSITNNLTSGSIFSVNDVSGLPSLDIDANGTIVLAEFGGNVGIGTSTPGDKLDVVGSIRASSQLVSSVATGTAPLLVTSTTVVTNLNTDLLDGQHGSYYLDWANVTNKPDPVVTVTLTGDVTGSASATLTDLTSGTISISTTIPANSIVLGTDTSGDYLENVTAGTGITISGTKGEGWTATIAHADTSTQTSVNNINGTVIQDITLDGFGHITDIESINLDLRYLGIGAKAADSDLLDGQDGSYYLNTSTTFGGDVSGTYNAIVVANDSHTHDTRYYTETESDARFLGINAKAADSDLLDGQDGSYYLNTATVFGGDVSGTYDAIVVANDSHTHDGRYYTEAEADGRFLGINAKAADTELFDGIDSGSFLRSDVDDTFNGNLTLTGELRGPATFVIDPAAVGDNTGKVIIRGDFQVDGTTTTINSTTLTVDDKAIVVASGAGTAAAADGAGISVDGANATITYSSSGDSWVFNKAPYYSTNRILTTADEGAGNGLDADTLDGQQGSYYLNASNINAGVIGDAYLPATISSDITGNAATATKLATARSISLTGDVTGSVSFDGSANVSITAAVVNDSHTHDGRYYTESEADARFLGINAKAADSNLLDGVDSGSFLRSDTSDNFTGVLQGNNPGGTYLNLRGGSDDNTLLLRVSAAQLNENISSNLSSDYGFNIRYRGDLNGVENALQIDADNQAGTAIEALRIKQNGVVYFGPTPQVGSNVIWHAGNDGSGSGLDADTLDGQQGTYYLDYNNFSNTPTIGNGTLTVNTGGGLTGSGTFTANQTTNATITVSHADTSSVANLTASSRTYVTALTFDTYGHVTGYSTGTETVVDTNTTYGISAETTTGGANLRLTGSDASTDDVKFAQGANISISRTDANTITISGTNTTYSAGAGLDLNGTVFSHTDTSSQASVNNSNGTVIQDITLDTFGHITAIGNVDLDTRYLGINAKAADSNLLDGIDSGSFLRSDANDTFSGTLTYSGTGTALNFTSTSEVILADHSSNSTSVPFDIRKSGSTLADNSSYGVLHLSRLNHNNSSTSAGASLYFQLRDSGGTLREYAGISGQKTEAGAAGGRLQFYRYGRTSLGYWDSTGLYVGSSKVWHAGNDGSGSGLDADLLDGQQGSYYLNTSTTFGGDVSGTYNAIVVANDSHTHDTRYYTEAESDARFLGINAKAADSHLLDGIDSGSFLRSDANDSFSGNLTNSGNNYITFGPNSTWGAYLRIGGNGYQGASGIANIATTNGNLHLDAAPGGSGTYLNYYTGTAGVVFGNGASGAVAWMGSDGDLWKGSNDNTGSKYWHAGNDGSGSGLDADLLDGQQGSYYLDTSATTQTKSGGLNVSGNVGIGTTNPVEKLHVVGNVYAARTYLINSSDAFNTAPLVIQGVQNQNSAIIIGQPNVFNWRVGNQGTTGTFYIGSASTDQKLSIKTDGNVGIGTTNPQSKLHVHGGILAVGSDPAVNGGVGSIEITDDGAATGIGFYDSSIGGSSFRIYREGDVGYISRGSTPAVYIDSGRSVGIPSAVGIGTTDPTGAKLEVIGDTGIFVKSSTNAPTDGAQIRFSDNQTSDYGQYGWLRYKHGNDAISPGSNDGFVFGGSETNTCLKIEGKFIADGNVGIGTTNPTQKLTVWGGDVLIDGSGTATLTVGSGSYAGTHSVNVIGGGSNINNGYALNGSLRLFNNTSGTSSTYIAPAPGADIIFANSAGGGELVRIKNAGNVGIGTTNPSYKLEVNGSFAATTKSFVIPHPTKEGHKLRYGSLEGPENGIYARGRSKEFIIELPEYWTKLIDPDSITVSLTSIGHSGMPRVEKIEDNKVYVFTKDPEPLNYFYTIFAERIDVEKLEVEFPVG